MGWRLPTHEVEANKRWAGGLVGGCQHEMGRVVGWTVANVVTGAMADWSRRMEDMRMRNRAARAVRHARAVQAMVRALPGGTCVANANTFRQDRMHSGYLFGYTFRQDKKIITGRHSSNLAGHLFGRLFGVRPKRSAGYLFGLKPLIAVSLGRAEGDKEQRGAGIIAFV